MDALLAHLDTFLFHVFAALALGSAIVVVAQPNPLYSAFALIVTLCSLSAVFGLLGSPFIAALQIVVYAGAIMVLFLFVLMLLNVKREEHAGGEGRTLKAVALTLVVLLAGQVGRILVTVNLVNPGQKLDGSTEKMAHVLFATSYLYVFEATSILILAALVGAVVLAKKEL